MVTPALDRLADLVERVVALLDDLSPERDTAPRGEETVADRTDPREREQVADAHVVFVPSPEGYALVARVGPPPGRGETVELPSVRFRVLRLGPSPLPGDRRRCAFVEGEEPPRTERTPDR